MIQYGIKISHYILIYTMLLSREEKTRLLARFPSLELSYENVLHRKVQADVYMLIPDGQKSFVWFSYWQDKNVCFVILLNNNNNICDIKAYPACFDSKLSLNTVIYGTLFRNNNLTHFSCERLFYYKNNNTSKYTFLKQLDTFKNMFDTELKQVAYTSEFLILGLPIIKTNYEHMLACIGGLPYNVNGIQFYTCASASASASATGASASAIATGASASATGTTGTTGSTGSGSGSGSGSVPLGIFKIHKPNLPEANFKVKALLEPDVYELYCEDSDVVNSIALIPSYKCSVMMNSLFRNIKENSNLDLLEESDDEDYENNNVDKFVDLDKSYNMRCVYNKKFKKWQPIHTLLEKV